MFRKRVFGIACLSVIVGIVGLIFSIVSSRAATVTPGPLTITHTGDTLFSETNIEPGDVIVKDVSVRNIGTLPHSFSISVTGVSGDLANVIHIEPRENGVPIWNESLADLGSLSNQSKVILSSINPGSTRNLQFAAIFPVESGNQYQGSSATNFNFVFGNDSTDQREPSTFSGPARTFGQGITLAITYNPPANEADSVRQVNSTEQGGEAKGDAAKAKELCFWWIVMLVILAIGLTAYNRFKKSVESVVVWWLWPVLFAVGLYIAHYYLERGYKQTIFCHWFWAVEILVLVIYYIIELKKSRE